MTEDKKGAIAEALETMKPFANYACEPIEDCKADETYDCCNNCKISKAHANLQAFVDGMDLDKLRQEEYSMKYLVDLTQHMYEATKGIEGC